MAFVTSDDGVRLHCEEAGRGQAVVFAHEFAGDARSWEPQLRHFSRRYRCVAYCARGYPPSEVPAEPERYSQERAAADLRAVIEGLQLERPHLVGLSMGGFATLHFALQHCRRGQPARARSMVLAAVGTGAHPSVRPQFQASARAWAQTIREKGLSHFSATYGQGPTRLQFQKKDPRGFAEYTAQLASHSAEGTARTLEGYLAQRPGLYDLADSLSQIELPALVMVGDEDAPCLDTSIWLKRTLPAASLAVLPRSGHPLNAEEPALFNQLVSDFFARVESETAGPG